MAKDKKGKEGASRAHQRWSPPVAEDIHPGDTLQFYSPESSFEFRVLSLQHGGEWIFGTPMNDPELKHGGPLAVKRSDCMTPETARRGLEHLPTISVEAPTLA